MQNKTLFAVLVGLFLISQAAKAQVTSGLTEWPTHDWAKERPASVGLDEKVLAAFDGDLARGKYSLVDSFALYRCGKLAFERTYTHDYGQIYYKEAHAGGPLNAHGTGWYNYFDPAWHPYFHGTDLHSMQSVSKTVSSVIIGIAMTRGDFKAGLDTLLLKYFDISKVKNVDDRKKRIRLRDVLTMTTGLAWDEEVAYDHPRNDSSLMEATDAEQGYKYGFKWWLLLRTDRQGFVWMARGFGGQRLMVFPEEDMIAVFTGWEILKDEAEDIDLVSRILPGLRTQACGVAR
jgi:hypothetical protein